MKKKIALLLTIAMMTGLAACGSGQTTKEETAAASGTEAAVEQQSAEEKETAAETESITETQAAADESEQLESEIKEEDKKFAAGKMEGSTYTQEFFGFKLELDSPWQLQSEEELLEQNQMILDATDDESTREAIKESLENGNLFVDFTAYNTDNGNTIMVRILKIDNILPFVLNPNMQEDFTNQIKESLVSDAEYTGITDISSATEDVTFLGKTVKSAYVKGMYPVSEETKMDFFERGVFIRRGSYAAVIFCTGFTDLSGENSQELLDLFQPL